MSQKTEAAYPGSLRRQTLALKENAFSFKLSSYAGIATGPFICKSSVTAKN